MPRAILDLDRLRAARVGRADLVLAQHDKGEKVYALLREAMRKAGVLGIARVVMHTKEHLAALIATDSALMLNTLRWSIRRRRRARPKKSSRSNRRLKAHPTSST
jgi:non-homologous end joining protein Ku